MRFFDIGSNRSYFDDNLDKEIMQRVARNCYLPANALLLKLIRKNPHIKVAFSISGVTIDQLEQYAPEVLVSFRSLAATGSVEFLAETYYHSLACMAPRNEFEIQVVKHQQKIEEHFGVCPTVFRNTELIYNDAIGHRVADLGFTGIFTDGVDSLLGNQSPHHVFSHPVEEDMHILLRDYRLSDEIAFRFSQHRQPMTANQYIAWLTAVPEKEAVINLALDYETFGEHHKKETGIFTFLENLITAIAGKKTFRFLTPSEAVKNIKPSRPLAVPAFISWADEERDLSAWLGNEMQRDAFDSIMKLESDVKLLRDKTMLRDWRLLQTSDHFYYMSTKKGNDGGVHAYFSPYPSPYEAFINYMNVLTDFSLRLKTSKAAAKQEQHQKSKLIVNRENYTVRNGYAPAY